MTETMTNGTVNVNALTARRSFPAWHRRGKIRKVDGAGNVLPGQYACNGEEVEISPRFFRDGANYRVRPVRPAAFFAAWLFSNKHLDTLLTGDEATQEEFLQLLEKLWPRYKHDFPQLGSPLAACDYVTVPGPRTGFSFNVLQVLVEITGSVRPLLTGNGSRPAVANGSPDEMEALRQQIDALRARNAAAVLPALTPEQVEISETFRVCSNSELKEAIQTLAEVEAEHNADPMSSDSSAPVTEPSVEKPTANGKKRK